MIKFSIPYNHDIEVIKKIISLYRNRIEEVYFSIDSDIATTSKKKNDKMPILEAKELIGLLKKNKIKSNMLINGVYQGNRDPKRIRDYISKLDGLDSITIADLYLLEIFYGQGLKIQISRLAQLSSVEKIRRILARYPDLIINIDNDLNRDLGALKGIAILKNNFPKFRIKLMVNEGCLFHCIGRTRHAWLLCLDESQKKYSGKHFSCFKQITLEKVNKEIIKSAFIRPEDLVFYERQKLVDVFKIAGRYRNSKELLAIVEAYMKKSYKGSLVDLMGTGVIPGFAKKYFFDIKNKSFPKDFIKKVLSCDKICIKCNYCEKVAEKVLIASDSLKDKLKLAKVNFS